jgi:hypothetical protein
VDQNFKAFLVVDGKAAFEVDWKVINVLNKPRQFKGSSPK